MWSRHVLLIDRHCATQVRGHDLAVLGVLGAGRLAMADDDLDMFIDLAATDGRNTRKD